MIKMLLIWITSLTLIAELSSEQVSLDRPQVFCGRALAEARMLYCLSTDEMFADFQQKRSTSLEDYKKWWMARRMAYMMGGSGKGNGLVEECCFKPCYLSELLSYC